MNIGCPTTRGYSRLVMAVMAIVMAWTLGTAEARADSPSPQQMEQFEAHVSEAARALDSGDYQTGVAELKKAAEIVDHPRLQFQLGEAYTGLDDCHKAQQTYEALQRRDDVDDAMRERIADRRERLGECPQVGELFLRCEPRDLVVTVDGERWSCSQWMELDADVYLATAEHDNYEPQPVTIELDAGERLERLIILENRLPSDDDSDDTLSYAGYGSLGMGGVLIGVGLLMETRTSGRAGEMVEARQSGDTQRIDELMGEADSARKRTLLSYGFGLTALAVGGGLLYYSSTRKDDEPRVDIGLGPGGINTRLRW